MSNPTGTATPNTPPGNTGASLGEPRKDFFVRENASDAVAGPFTFDQADKNARALSDDEDKSGLAEMVTFVGNRGGDPVKDQAEIFVVYMYIRGKRSFGGRVATFHSDRNLPPVPVP